MQRKGRKLMTEGRDVAGIEHCGDMSSEASLALVRSDQLVLVMRVDGRGVIRFGSFVSPCNQYIQIVRMVRLVTPTGLLPASSFSSKTEQSYSFALCFTT
uniref:(northern house mosquito) hypothetical protein n=1 Tax=Culex pipiens TaxID=7175 RepID=A0A8D8AVA7_CULPI